MPILAFIMALAVVSCTHQLAETAPNPADEPSPASESTRTEIVPEITAALREKAEQFDKYLNGKLNDSEVAAYKESCQKAPQENLFCSTIARGEALERRIRNRIKYPRSAPKRPPLQPFVVKIVGK